MTRNANGKGDSYRIVYLKTYSKNYNLIFKKKEERHQMTKKEIEKLPVTKQYWLEWISTFNLTATKKQFEAFVTTMEEQIGEHLVSMEVFDSLGIKMKEAKKKGKSK